MNLQRIPRWLVLGLFASSLAACDFDFDKDSGSDDGADDGDDGDDADDADDADDPSCGDPSGDDHGDDEPSDPSAGDDDGDPGDPSDPSEGDACDLGPVPAPDPALLDGLAPNASAVAITDCDVDAGYEVDSWRATSVGATKLWVGGVYETRGDHGFGYHPTGEGFVSWSIPGSNVLVVSSYEPTHWTIELAAGGELERVVAIGYHEQTVDAPAGVVVETYAYETGSCYFTCGYALPGEGGGCEGEELVAMAQHVTGLELYAFDGCYNATTFAYAP